MEATELRIGNWYDHNGTYRQATWDTIHEVWEAQRSWCKPIPLTEEILLKCGFEKYSEGNFVLGNFILSYLTTDENFEFEYKVSGIDSWLLKDIKYLHQLQNLYHALTGEELTVNL